LLAVVLLNGCAGTRPHATASAPASARGPDSAIDPVAAATMPPTDHAAAGTAAAIYEARVKPLLGERCGRCHFPGGRMHARLPFDDPATVRALGTKLYTRIEDAEGRAAIQAFLEAAP
jgi:hypothetical protein